VGHTVGCVILSRVPIVPEINVPVYAGPRPSRCYVRGATHGWVSLDVCCVPGETAAKVCGPESCYVLVVTQKAMHDLSELLDGQCDVRQSTVGRALTPLSAGNVSVYSVSRRAVYAATVWCHCSCISETLSVEIRSNMRA
jgi:hypothetical protein